MSLSQGFPSDEAVAEQLRRKFEDADVRQHFAATGTRQRDCQFPPVCHEGEQHQHRHGVAEVQVDDNDDGNLESLLFC